MNRSSKELRGLSVTRQSLTEHYGPRFRDAGLGPVTRTQGRFHRFLTHQISPTYLILAGLLLVLATVVITAMSSCGAAGGTAVTMKDFKFQPDTVTIKKGQSVTWTNEDRRRRQVMSGNPPVMTDQFMSPVLENGQSYTFTFEQAGEFPYHDMMIPGVTGRVIVEE